MEEQKEISSIGKDRRHFLKTLLFSGASVAARPLEATTEALFNSPNTNETGFAQSASSVDSALESRIDSFVKEKRRSGYLSPTDQISVTVYDIQHDRKLVSINEDTRRMAASTIKDFVMLAVFDQIQAGNIKYLQRVTDSATKRSYTVKDLIESIISYKYGFAVGNRHTNLLIDLLKGPARVDAIVKKYGLFSETRIIEKIPPRSGRTYKNTTSTHDLNIFYNQMWHNKLPYSVEMRRILGMPKSIATRLYTNTCIPEGVLQYTKSGSVFGLNADSGILVMKKDKDGQPHPYGISIMIEDKTKPYSKASREVRKRWSRRRSELIRDISEGVYDFLYQTHMGKSYYCKQHRGNHLGGRQ